MRNMCTIYGILLQRYYNLLLQEWTLAYHKHPQKGTNVLPYSQKVSRDETFTNFASNDSFVKK